jgi:transposase
VSAGEQSSADTSALLARIAELEAALRAKDEVVESVTAERDRLRASYERLREELALLKRRIFVAKAERVDTAQLELEFAQKLAELNRAAGTVKPGDDEPESPKTKHKPKGRRNLKDAKLIEQRVEIDDPLFEQLVADGKAKRIGFEETYKLAYQRGGARRLVIARVKYRTVDQRGESAVELAPLPPETFTRLLAAPSMLAHIAHEKHGRGLPLHRIETQFALDGVPIDRGTMCRWLEDLGATLGATVITAARKHAFDTAFCIATDATGIAVQPIRTHEKARQNCCKGNYFVHVVDRDHVFFEYTARETSAKVAEMFRGFRGYLQADAKSVYDSLFRPPDPDDDDETAAGPTEVGCWSHARRKYWEAAMAKNVVAREALARIARIFELDASWQKEPPAEIKRLRQVHLRVHLDTFFAWAEAEHEKVQHQRGMLRSALGYSVRQKAPLMRFLDDGRLVMTNNRAENNLRKVATGRDAWLFVGSDDHAQSAGHILSLIASARLHGIDAEQYLRDLVRVLAHWPRDRYLELAPVFWNATRARLDAVQMDREIGRLSVPDPLPTAEQQAGPG